MIRGRQATIVPLVLDPASAGATFTLLDGPGGPAPHSGRDVFTRYIQDGPAEPPTRHADGAGSFLVELDEGTVRVDLPPCTWVEIRGDWTPDDEDDLAADIGPSDPLGGVLAERMTLGEEGRAALSAAVADELHDWLAAHCVSLVFGSTQVKAGDGADDELAVRREAALRDLGARLSRHVEAPGVAGKLAMVRGAAEGLGDHPLRQTIVDICDSLDRIRPLAEADLSPAERRAFRQKRKRDRRWPREMARRTVLRFHGPGWDDEPLPHWQVFETDVPPVIRTRLEGEIAAHAARVATRLPPKRRRASSPACG